jgi:L-amino acid N-acyltransferase YncA
VKPSAATINGMISKYATCLPAARPLPTAIEASRALNDGGRQHESLIPLVRQPWLLRAGTASLVIRPATYRDLEGVAGMHARCSARSLLDRYRAGGRGPSVPTLQRQLRRPLAFVAATRRGAVLGFAVAGIDVNHSRETAQIGLLVEDEWQGVGIGRELMTHLAGAAVVCGYTEMVAYTATSVLPMQRLMLEVGHSRIVADPTHAHLHTSLPESAALGLGPVRERLAS